MSNVPVKGVRNDPFDESRIFFLLLHTYTQNILRYTIYLHIKKYIRALYIHISYTGWFNCTYYLEMHQLFEWLTKFSNILEYVAP